MRQWLIFSSRVVFPLLAWGFLGGLGLAQAPLVGPPRLGQHEHYTRIVYDLPAGVRSTVSVIAEGLRVELQDAQLEDYTWQADDPHIEQLKQGDLAGGILILPRSPMTSAGAGFAVTWLPGSAGSPDNRLVIDIGAELHHEGALSFGGQAASLSATSPAAVEPNRARPTVVIDPGHGGIFAGAQGYAQEEEVTLAVAKQLRDLLVARGFEVVMTRDGDRELSADYVTDLNTRAGFARNDYNIFISIHANSAESNTAQGIETWVYGQPLSPEMLHAALEENGGEAGREATQAALADVNSVMADIVSSGQLSYSLTLAEIVQNTLVGETGARDRGVKQSAFLVLCRSRIPAVLVELGFVNNADEGVRLATEAYQAELATGLANAVSTFFSQSDNRANGLGRF